jgi:ATP-dependent protease ClpP protease subunit
MSNIILTESVEKSFMEENPIINVFEFTLESSIAFNSAITELESDPSVKNIIINISSYGGELFSVFSMVERLNKCIKPVFRFSSGYAGSAGALLLASGDVGTRYMGSDTRMLIHSVKDAPEAPRDVSTEELESFTSYHSKLNNQFFKILCSNCKISVKDLWENLREHNGDWELTAKEAINYGFADKVGNFRIKTIRKSFLEIA